MFCIFSTVPGRAETLPANARVHGRVLELGSPNPLPQALVATVGNSYSAESDEKGWYTLDLEPGPVDLRCSAAGHAPLEKSLSLDPGQNVTVNFSLDRVDFTAATVVVKGKKDKPQVLTTTLTQTEIKKIPGTAGDALRAVQNLPGIAIPNDFSGVLVVQGGGPNDNLYLLDNLPWPFPFHFGGVLSTMNSDLLTTVDLHAAGFGVRWGDTLDAVLDAKTRAGQKDRIHAALDLNLATAQALVEGPLGIGDASFTLAGRRSYFDLFLGGLLNSEAGSSSFTALPYFWDLGGSLDFSLDPSNHVHALALGNDDILGVTLPKDETDFTGEFRMDNRAYTGGFSWVNTSLPELTSTLTPYYYQIYLAEALGTGFNFNFRQDIWGLKEELQWRAGEWLGVRHEVNAGGSLERANYTAQVYLYKNFVNGAPTDPTGTTVNVWTSGRGAYLEDRLQFGPDWAFTAGLRYDKSDFITEDVLTPRLGLEWRYDERTLWKAAWGQYGQFPSPQQLDENFGNPALTANRAEHTVLSLEKKFSRELTGRIDAYYKYYHHLVVDDPAQDTLGNQGLGDAKGVEVFLNADLGERFFGWVSYAYSRSERFGPPRNDWNWYRYDQPNILTAVAHYSFTPAWSIGAKLHYNSGPLVQTLLGRYQDAGGVWRGVFSDEYNQRLDDYLRLDLRMDYSWRFQGWRLNAYIEILNFLNRANPADLSYPKNYDGPPKTINNLPYLPYFGLEAQF
jgi:hypothetical protein